MRQGKVYLVGAGPGDPDLITVKGRQCLQQADVIIYDHLASAKLLRHTKPGAEAIYVGKEQGSHTLPQDEMNKLLVAKAKAGHMVVRLKGGHPFIFGRGGEEAQSGEENRSDHLHRRRLRDEAAVEPSLEVPQGEPTSKTQIIAIYGKGGIGKSFTLANLSHMMAEQGMEIEEQAGMSRNMLMSAMTGEEISSIDCPDEPIKVEEEKKPAEAIAPLTEEDRQIKVAAKDEIHSLIRSGRFDYVILEARRPGYLLPAWVDLPDEQGRRMVALARL